MQLSHFAFSQELVRLNTLQIIFVWLCSILIDPGSGLFTRLLELDGLFGLIVDLLDMFRTAQDRFLGFLHCNASGQIVRIRHYLLVRQLKEGHLGRFGENFFSRIYLRLDE